MSDHERFYRDAETAIDDVFGDKSVSQQETVETLEALAEKIADCIGAIKADLRREESSHE